MLTGAILLFICMSYYSISVHETISRINNEWFLPAIQRPYVWGSRYGSESFICKLFDSLYRGYPIGALIVWKTESEVYHRRFFEEYTQGDVYKNEPRQINGRFKSLIYDGQQRLQTLYSCLKFSFDHKFLVFNLLYDPQKDKDNATGFRFIEQTEKAKPTEISLVEVCECLTSYGKIAKYKKKYTATLSERDQDLVDNNLYKLWHAFVDTNNKSLGYFEIETEDEDVVNEVFERLNTGGMSLSNSDMLFSNIKARFPDFEAEILQFSKKLYSRTGIAFNAYDILQLLHLIVEKKIRVAGNVKEPQLDRFNQVWTKIQEPINDFFDRYLKGYFKITKIDIIRSKMPLFVLLVFFYRSYEKGWKYQHFNSELQRTLNQFFIISEINEWTLQSYIDNFSKIIESAFEAPSLSKPVFPFEEMKNFVRQKGNRNIEVSRITFENNRLFSLKILLRNRVFEFDDSMPGRFNPEIDHIFPIKLVEFKDDSEYQKIVNILWNFQPVRGQINNTKRNYDPYKFFTDQIVNSKGDEVCGSKYWNEYDELPDLNDPCWHDYRLFIDRRKEKLIAKLEKEYGITFQDEHPSDVNDN